MNDITLIKAAHQDIPKLISFEKDASGEKTYSAMLTEEDWLEEFQKSRVFFITYKQDIVGELSYEERDFSEIYISGILILKEFRGHGIARKVLSDLLNQYSKYNFSLVTHPDNQAIFLYQSLGFKILERVENYFGDGEPRLKLYLSREGSK